MKQIVLPLFLVFTGCLCPECPVATVAADRGLNIPENTFIVECEMVGEHLMTDTFYAPDNFIMPRYTTGAHPKMSSFHKRAWNGETYRFDTSEETDSCINFYYYSKSCDTLH